MFPPQFGYLVYVCQSLGHDLSIALYPWSALSLFDLHLVLYTRFEDIQTEMVKCKKWVLAEPFAGEVKPGNFRLEQEDISESLKDGGMWCFLIVFLPKKNDEYDNELGRTVLHMHFFFIQMVSKRKFCYSTQP